MDFKERPLAVVDVETTGDDPIAHEILEIGLVLARQEDLSEIEAVSWQVKPRHIENAMPVALDLNGYNEKEWAQAKDLPEVMADFSEKTKDAVFVSYNVAFDWGFMRQAFKTTNTSNFMDYHFLDVMSTAWFLSKEKLPRFKLKTVCEFFGVPPEPDRHRALDGARTALALLRKLRERIGR